MVIDRLTGLPVVLHNDPLVEKFVSYLKEHNGSAQLHSFEIGMIMHVSHPTALKTIKRLEDYGYVEITSASNGKRNYSLTIDALKRVA